MRAIAMEGFGGSDVLRPADVPEPEPAAGEVKIRVYAAGVNRPDIVQRQGLYPPPPGASELLGLEVAGEIVALGAGTAEWNVGDRVCALLTGGGYAEYCVAPSETVLPVPEGMDFITAAAIPETYFTVWSNVFERAYLDAGETLLVHGGTSGIGTTAIQLAKAFDARVIATAGTDAKCAFCEKLGASPAINYRTRDWEAEVLAATEGRGVDVVLDMVGGAYVPKNINCLAENGRHVTIAFLAGPKAEINLVPIMRKRLTLTGSTLRPRDKAFKGAIAEALSHHVWPLLESGAVAPVIDRVFALEAAAEAHAWLESGDAIGKVVLKV